MRMNGRCALLASTLAMGGAVLAQVGGGWQPQQSWSAEERSNWYGASQGSRWVPWRWMAALEQAGSTKPFLDPANMGAFGYLPGGPRGMPIGFAVDERSDGSLARTKLRWYAGQGDGEGWVGLTCAACHTGAISYGGRTLLIDGGQGLGDFQSMVDSFDAALEATRADPAKWSRFAAAVLNGDDDGANRAELLKAFDDLLAWQRRLAAADATPHRSGFGRVDAFGHIFNKVALSVGAAAPGGNPPDASVSYPYLWGISAERRLQWNGSAFNTPMHVQWTGGTLDLGALGRNAGEVIGVFGEARPTAGGRVFASSVDFENLNSIETQLRTLAPPKWPDWMPPIDRTAANAGERLYTSMCAGCHVRPGIDRVPTKQGWGTELMSYFNPRPGEDLADTDQRTACNAHLYSAPTGALKGMSYEAQDANGAKAKYVLGRTGPIAAMLPMVVKGAMVGSAPTVAKISLESMFNMVPPPRPTSATPPPDASGRWTVSLIIPSLRCMTERSDVLGYKARPLAGVWATPPYLHNGSVPSLMALLSAPSARPPVFWTGGRDYDPKVAGYVSSPGGANTFKFDTTLPGNGNGGHIYGVDRLDDTQRTALIEYLKTL